MVGVRGESIPDSNAIPSHFAMRRGDGGTLEKEVTGCFGDKGKFSSSAPISGIVLGGFDAVAS